MVRFGQLFALLCALNIGLGQARNVLVKRQADEEDSVVVSNEETSDDIKDKNDTNGQEGVDLIKVIRDAVGGALEALRGVVEAKQEAVKPIVSAAQRTGTVSPIEKDIIAGEHQTSIDNVILRFCQSTFT